MEAQHSAGGSAVSGGAPAWLAPLLAGSSHRRFFQLSADLTTLRWAWNKYVLLYYVDSITADEAALTLTLHMALDPGELA